MDIYIFVFFKFLKILNFFFGGPDAGVFCWRVLEKPSSRRSTALEPSFLFLWLKSFISHFSLEIVPRLWLGSLVLCVKPPRKLVLIPEEPFTLNEILTIFLDLYLCVFLCLLDRILFESFEVLNPSLFATSISVQWLERRSKAFEPTYLYTVEKVFYAFSPFAFILI